MTTRAEVVSEARRWIGTPWQHQARSIGLGVDCVGFVIEVGRALRLIDTKEAATYKRRPDGLTLRAKFSERLASVDLRSIRPADVLLIATHGTPDHVAIVGDYPVAAGELSMIHAYVPARKVVEHRLDPLWRRKIVAAFALPGVE